MRLLSKITTLVLLCLLVTGHAVLGQSAPLPAPPLAAAIEVLQKQYEASFPGLPQLYSGPEYVDLSRRFHARTGHPFFLAAEPVAGSVQLDGYQYRDRPLLYDVVHDQLVLGQAGSPVLLLLPGERVSEFRISGHRFIRLVADSASADVLRTGYYEVLADSACQVLARRSKRQQQKVVSGNIDLQFEPTDRLFVRKENKYYLVTKKSAALRLFADRSREVQQVVQERRLSFKKAHLEASLVQLARYYNQVVAQPAASR